MHTGRGGFRGEAAPVLVMMDVSQVLSDAEVSLRKIQHGLRSEVSRRLIIDIESLLGSVRMLEVEVKQKDNDAARAPADHRHD